MNDPVPRSSERKADDQKPLTRQQHDEPRRQVGTGEEQVLDRLTHPAVYVQHLVAARHDA